MNCKRVGLDFLGVVLLTTMIVVSPAAFAAAEPPNASVAPSVDKSIAVDSRSGSDAKIKARLLQLFEALDGLGDVRVDVTGGVVALSGEVPTRAAHDQALQIVRRIEGVAEVRDQIDVSRSLSARLGQLQRRITGQLLNAITYVPLFVVAALVVALFWWLSGLLTRSERLTRHFGRNPFIRDLIRQALRTAFLGLGVLLALEVLDASTLFTSLLGAAGVVGLAVGFALRDAVENYIASLLLSLRQPFASDDLVTIDGLEGRVVRLNARATVLLTPDGTHLRIPNAKVYKAIIVNFTRNPKRRFHFDVGIDPVQNLTIAQQLATATLAKMKGIDRDPAPACIIQTLGDSSVVLRTFGWVDQTKAEFGTVRSEAIRLVKGAFDRAGVVMPAPTYNINVDSFPEKALTQRGGSTRPARAKGRDPTESQSAIDVEPRDNLTTKIEDIKGADEEDLLHPEAARE